MLTSPYTTIALMVFLYMTSMFCISLLIKRNDIVDIAWGMGFLLISSLGLYLGGYPGDTKLLIVFLVALWSIRLSVHIFLRNTKKKEDYRYKQWRKDWGKYFIIRSFLQIYMLQGFLMYVIALPVTVALVSESAFYSPFIFVGLAIWIIGFFFEAVGDYQLSQFKKDTTNKGKIMTTGVWKYTRHPNYFGEVTLWWGMFVITFSQHSAWSTIIGPLTITFFILKVSGIPMLERKYEGNKEFEEYKKKTNAFFPWFPGE